MKVKTLKTILAGLNESDDEREILMSSDPEGNEIMDINNLASADWRTMRYGKEPIVIWPKHRS